MSSSESDVAVPGQPLERGPTHPAPEDERRARRTPDVLSPRSFSLWFAIGGPPLLWGAQVAIGDLIFELGCGRAIQGRGFLLLSLKAWSLIVTGVILSSAVIGFLLAWRAARILRTMPGSAVRDRAYAMAIAGIAVGVVFFVLIGYSLLTPFFLPTCGASP
ncbi:MAG TPA: hypothetical protein VKA30_07100 [Actinomycetota bacterium]|nr:hypothetical protein [Actinomycetota bacterium]